MPKREDDFWASQKEGLKYCARHKRYYREDVGCQLCYYENSRAAGTEKEIPKLQECPRCHEHSLFYNDRDGIYECLNRKCRARGKSPSDIETKKRLPTQKGKDVVTTTTPHVSQPVTPDAKTAPAISTNAVNLWLESKTKGLSFWWRYHKPRRIRVTKRSVSRSWGILKKTLIFLLLLAVTTIIVSAVSLVIAEAITIVSGVIIAALGLTIGVWCSNSLSFHRISFARFFMIIVISIVFIMVSTAYLDIRSLDDVRNSIVNALSIIK